MAVCLFLNCEVGWLSVRIRGIRNGGFVLLMCGCVIGGILRVGTGGVCRGIFVFGGRKCRWGLKGFFRLFCGVFISRLLSSRTLSLFLALNSNQLC